VRLIFSDDLTGACDVGAECIRSGWRVRVEFGGPAAWKSMQLPGRGEIVVVDLETRRLSPRMAGKRAGDAGKAFGRRGIRPFFFKMDSTLRGNFVREAESLRNAVHAPLVWFVPANPAQGRWTVEGRVFVNGIPLERSAYARDPLYPARTGEIPGYFPERKAARLLLHERLSTGMRRSWISRGVTNVSVDATGDDDLQSAAKIIPQSDLVFGASPMAKFLAGRAPGNPRTRARMGGRWPACWRGRRVEPWARRWRQRRLASGGRWLGIFGSLNPLTTAQLKRAGKCRGTKVAWIGPEHLHGGREIAAPAGARVWLVALNPGAFRYMREGGGSLGRGNRIAGALGRISAQCMRNFSPDGLMLSGGLTAMGVCENLGITGLSLHEELSPGLVSSSALWKGPALEIITKPGGFGAENALAETVARIWRA